MRVTSGEGLTVVGDFLVTKHHQGAPGLAHGGLLTLAIDEILSSLNALLADPAVTGRLECDFRRPVPVGSTLHVDAEIVGVKGRKVFTRAVGRLNGRDGQIAISAAALFIQVPIQHFVTHGAAEHVQQAIDDRAAGSPAWFPDAEQGYFQVNP